MGHGRLVAAVGVVLAGVAPALAAAADDGQVILLKAGKLYVSPDQVIKGGQVLIQGGKIAKVGTALTAPEGAVVIDRPKGTITAGLIDANAAIGFSNPFNRAEHESECIPQLRVIEMIDLGHRDFDTNAAAGVTTVCINADAASVIGARGTIVKTGGPAGERIVREAYGIRATVGREPVYKASRNRTPFRGTSYLTRRPTTRMGLVWAFRKAFHDAQIFARGQVPGTRGEGSPSEEVIGPLQAVLRGEIPLRVQARTQYDILTAIRLCDEFGIPFVLDEGTDANRCVNELREKKVPVVFGPLFDYPTGFRVSTGEMARYRYSTPAVLQAAGITVALSAVELSGEAGLPQQATYAMRFGLTRAQALAAVTTTPAKILGIQEIAGTISEGHPADLVVWSGEPFAATTRADVVLIGGSVVKKPRP